ncbi:MAG: HEAT repeat domain-containing protein [Chloroflexota bacterium]
MGPDDRQIEALIAELDQQDKPAIRAAVDQLIALTAESPRLRELLNHRLTESGHKNYWPVAYVLGHQLQPSIGTLEVLLDALDHREPDIRWAIALLLTRIAKIDGSIVQRLMQLSASGTVNQKRMALYCLRDLSLNDPASQAALLTALADPDATVRVAASICLKARPDLDIAGRNRLLQLYTGDKEPKVRHTAAIALAYLGKPSAELLAALKKNSESEDRETRKAAFAALALLEKRRSASSGNTRGR